MMARVRRDRYARAARAIKLDPTSHRRQLATNGVPLWECRTKQGPHAPIASVSGLRPMNTDPDRPWLVLAGLALGVTVTSGFARFAYGLMLPAMKSEMGWNYAQAGWLNTANALGYIAGAIWSCPGCVPVSQLI